MSAWTLSTVILLQGFVGTAIAAVGLFLLCKGRISLRRGAVSKALGVDAPPEFSIDVPNFVSIKTRNPALGLLSVAMILLLVPGYLARGDIKLVEVRGRLTGAEPTELRTALVTAYCSERRPNYDGSVRCTISLAQREVDLHIVAPGFEHGEGTVQLGDMSTRTGVYDIGEIDVTKVVGRRIKAKSDVFGPSVTPTIVTTDEPLRAIGEEDWDAEE